MRTIRMSAALLALVAYSIFFWSSVACLIFGNMELAGNMALASALTATFGIGTLIEEWMPSFI